MATVDTLLVRIEADMTDLRRGLDRVERRTERAASRMGKAFGRIRTAMGAALGVVAVRQAARSGGALVGLAGDVEEMQAKSSVVFGRFTKDFRDFTKDLGAEVNRSRFDLEEMGASVQDLFVPLGFARGEATEMSKTLTKLAVDVASFNNAQDIPTMQAFQSALVGNHEAVRRFGIVITEAELAAELLRMGIKTNAKDVDAQTKVQARLNLILAGTTDAHGDAARTAGSYTNSLKGLDAAFTDLGREIGAVFLPMAAQASQNIEAATKAVREFLAATGFIKDPISRMKALKEEIASLTKTLEEARAKQGAFQKDGILGAIFTPKGLTTKLEKDIQKLRKELKFLEDAQKKANISAAGDDDAADKKAAKLAEARKKRLDELKEQLEEVRLEAEKARLQVAGVDEETIRAFQDQGGRFNVAGPTGLADLFAPDQVDVVAQIREQAKARDELNKKLDEHERAMDNAKEAVDGLATEEDRLKQTLVDLKLALDNGTISQQQFKEATAATEKAIFEQSETGKLVIETIGDVSEGVAKSITEVLTNSGDGIENFKETFRNALNQIIQKLIQAQIEAVLFNQAMSAFGGGGGGFSLGGIFSGIGKMFGFGGQPSIPGPNLDVRATGGAVSARRSFIVGERGPELFTPRASGMVTPNNMLNMAMSGGQTLRGGGGGPNITQNINMSLGVAQTVRTEVMNMMPMIKQASVDAVIDARQRGGSLAAGLGA